MSPSSSLPIILNYVLALSWAIANVYHVEAYAIDRTHTTQNEQTIELRKPEEVKKSNSSPSPKPVIPSFDPRRPIWNLAHMVNSIKELDYRLEKGANAVEVDITFARDGTPLYTYHGPPCDCWRHCHQQENINDYLAYVREVAIEDTEGVGKNLTLLFLDLKLDYLDTRAKGVAGAELARSIMENLYALSNQLVELEQNVTSREEYKLDDGHGRITGEPRKKLYLILSVNHVTDVELIYNFLHHFESNNETRLLDYIGFDVGMNDDLQSIESMWRKFKNTINVWQGDGFTNCFSPFYNLERLSKALIKRDNDNGYPSKVYHWTIDLHDRMRESLMMGVDAVMTNHPERLLTILKEPEMAENFRLANSQDNPFKKITKRAIASASARSALSHRRERSSPNVPVTGGFLGSLLDVFYSWFAYVKEIPFLSLPTTSRFMPKTRRQRPLARNDTNSTIQILNHNGNSSVASNKELTSPYEGPKWYTTIASNFLLTMMKIFLPSG